MTSQNFNMHRFGLVLKKEIVENKKQILIALLCLFLGLALIMILGNLVTSTSNEDIGVENTGLPQMFVCGIFGLVGCIMASLMFGGLRSKTERIEHFMLPATVAEKFATQVVIYFLGYIVMFFICAQLADLVRYATLNLAGVKDVPGPINFVSVDTFNFPRVIQASAEVDGQTFVMSSGFFWLVISSCLFSFSFYMLGASLWPKLSFLKTMAAGYVLQTVLGILLLVAVNCIGVEDISHFVRLHWQPEQLSHSILVIMVVCYLVLTVVFSVAAYVIYKRKDVIKTSWL